MQLTHTGHVFLVLFDHVVMSILRMRGSDSVATFQQMQVKHVARAMFLVDE